MEKTYWGALTALIVVPPTNWPVIASVPSFARMVKPSPTFRAPLTDNSRMAPVRSTVPWTPRASADEAEFRSRRRIPPPATAVLPTFSVPMPVPPGETLPLGWTVRRVTFAAAPVPATVPVEETTNPLAAVTASVWVEFRVRVEFSVAGLLPALRVMFPVPALLSGALTTIPPAPVRSIGPPLVLATAPWRVSTPAVVLRAMDGAAAVAWPVVVVATADALRAPA